MYLTFSVVELYDLILFNVYKQQQQPTTKSK